MATFKGFIPNLISNDVSIVDIPANTVLATVSLPTGSAPFGSATRTIINTTKAYITNSGTNTVSVIDAFLHAVIATVPVGDTPTGVDVNPAGTRVYVANQADNTISVIDTSTDTVIATYAGADLSGPTGLVTNAAGTRLYVTNSTGDNVSVLDITADLPVFITTIPVGDTPIGVDISPILVNGTIHLFVANNVSDNLSIIDTATNTVVQTLAVGNDPFGVYTKGEFNPTFGLSIYVTNTGSSTVSRIEYNGVIFVIVDTIPVSGNPTGIADSDFAATSTTVYALATTDLMGKISAPIEISTLPIGNNPISLGRFSGLVQDIPSNTSDLAIVKTADTLTPSIGSNITFTITASNLGPDNAVAVFVEDILPPGFTFVSSSATIGQYNPVTGIWSIGNLDSGEQAVLTIIANVNPTGPYENTATVAFLAPQVDPNPANNVSTIVVTPNGGGNGSRRRKRRSGYPAGGDQICFSKSIPNGQCPIRIPMNGGVYKLIYNTPTQCCYVRIK